MTLLLDHIRQEARLQVRLALLSDLSLLAKPDTAHLWYRDNIEAMVAFCLQEKSEECLCCSIGIVRDIVCVSSPDHVSVGRVLELCEHVAFSGHVQVAGHGVELLTVLATCGSDTSGDMMDMAVMAIENICFVANSGHVQLVDIKRCLKCILIICQHQQQLTGQFVDILGEMMNKCETRDADTCHSVVTCLASLGSTVPGSLSPLLPDITKLITRLSKSESSSTLVTLLTLLLQTLRGCSWPSSASQAWSLTSSRLDCWHRYRLARAATRYGHHGLAANLFTEIAQYAESDTVYSWLEGLALVAGAENTLVMTTTMSLMERLTTSLDMFHRAMSSLRCATTTNLPLSFQLEFVKCRVAMVSVMSSIVTAASSLSTSPPPAIAVAHAQQSRGECQIFL